MPSKYPADKRKTKKMAEGGVASLGGMLSSTPSSPAGQSSNINPPPAMAPAMAQGGDLPSVQQKTDQSVQGGDGEKNYGYKKGGHITTRRVSSVARSKKAPSW